MSMNGIGDPVSDEGGSAAVEERPDEIAGAVALLGPGFADRVIDEEDEANTQAAAGPVGPEAAAEDDGHDGEDATAADDIISPAPAIDTAEESIAAARAEEGTPAAETTKADGQPASDTSPGDDTPEQPRAAADEDLPKSTNEVDGSSEILGPSRTKVMDLEAFGGTLDLDAYKDMFLEASQDEDDALLASVQTMDEIIVDVAESGRVLDKRRTYLAARRSGKKIKIKVRVHYGLSREQEKEKRYQLNEGGRQLTRKEKQKIQRERVWNLLWIRNIQGLTITQEFIARHTGYSLAWISKLEKEFWASNSSSSEKAVKRNLNRKMTPELVAKAKALIAQKTPIDEIAKEIGVHANTIRNSLKDPCPKASSPKAAAEEPPARKSSATGISRVTKPDPRSAQIPAGALDLGSDTNELVDEALDRLGIEQSKKSEWQAAGRRLLAERRENCPSGHQGVLKIALRARVEFLAAAADAERWVAELLRTNAEEVT